MKKLNYFLLNMSLRARNERGNLVAAQGEEAQLPDCFVPRNDKVFIVFGQFLRLIYCCIGSVILLSSCGGSSADSGDDKTVSAQTPVTVTSISDSDMVEYTTLNATSAFQQRNYVKSNTNGYIQKVFIHPGQDVEKGQVLFTLKTKEAQSIGNSVNIFRCKQDKGCRARLYQSAGAPTG